MAAPLQRCCRCAQGAALDTLRPLLDQAISKNRELHALTQGRIVKENETFVEMKKLLDAKAADIERCTNRARALDSALQDLTAWQGGVAPPPPSQQEAASPVVRCRSLTWLDVAALQFPLHDAGSEMPVFEQAGATCRIHASRFIDGHAPAA
jgi:hypothetical protein